MRLIDELLFFFSDSHGRAIVYVTFSKNKSENEDVVNMILDEQNEQRTQTGQKKENTIYR